MSPAEPDPYTVLNVPRTATLKEIRAAYRALAAKYHPDQHQGNPLADLAGARMAEINRAYERLSDPARRRATPGARPEARATRASTEGAARGRFFRGAALLLALPLFFRLAAIVPRLLGGLFRLLFEATASMRGARLGGLAGLVALCVLLVALFRRPRR